MLDNDDSQASAHASESSSDPLDVSVNAAGFIERIAQCLDLSPAAVYLRDRQGRYLATNRHWQELTGLGEEVRGKHVSELLPESLAESVCRMDEFVTRKGTAITSEEVLDTPLGKRKLLTVQFPLQDQESGFSGICGVSVDVTESSASQASPPESEERYRSLAEAIPDVLLRVTDDMTVRYISPAIERHQNLSAEQLTGQPLGAWALPDAFTDSLKTHIRSVFASGKTIQKNIETLTPRGLRWFDVRIIPEPTDDGQTGTCILLCRDITESRQTHEALRTRDSELARAQALAHVGTWAYNVVNGHTDWSVEMFRIFGIKPRETGLSVEEMRDYIEEEDIQRLRAAIERAVREGKPYELELGLRRSDGDRRHLVVRSEIIRDGHGEVMQLVGSCQDITDWRRADLQRQEMALRVQESQKFESLGLLAGGIAHEFNNLLVTILGNADLIMRDVPDQPGTQESLRDIREAALRASELSTQMLDYSGRGTFSIRPTDLNRQVRHVVSLLRGSLSRDIRVDCDLQESLPSVAADPAQLTQILTEVLTNAAEACEVNAPRTIRISTGLVDLDESAAMGYIGDDLQPGPHALLRVCDDGQGMDEQTRMRAFDPFFSTKFTGRGLGLGSVLGIVRGHHGGIRLESKPEDGTEVSIVLPVAMTQSADEEQSRHATPSDVGSGTLLIVDDLESVLQSTRRMAERLGFDVQTAASGQEAVNRLAADPESIRLAIVDLLMPDMDGRETVAELRRLRNDLPLLITSGYPPKETDPSFDVPGDGPVRFLKKPFDSNDLANVIRECLD